MKRKGEKKPKGRARRTGADKVPQADVFTPEDCAGEIDKLVKHFDVLARCGQDCGEYYRRLGKYAPSMLLGHPKAESALWLRRLGELVRYDEYFDDALESIGRGTAALEALKAEVERGDEQEIKAAFNREGEHVRTVLHVFGSLYYMERGFYGGEEEGRDRFNEPWMRFDQAFCDLTDTIQELKPDCAERAECVMSRMNQYTDGCTINIWRDENGTRPLGDERIDQQLDGTCRAWKELEDEMLSLFAAVRVCGRASNAALDGMKAGIDYLVNDRMNRKAANRERGRESQRHAATEYMEANKKAEKAMQEAIERVHDDKEVQKGTHGAILAACRRVCREFKPLTTAKLPNGKFQRYKELTDRDENPVQPETLAKNFRAKYGTVRKRKGNQ